MKKAEKFIIILLFTALIAVNCCIFFVAFNMSGTGKKHERTAPVGKTYDTVAKRELMVDANLGEYEVYQNDNLIDSFIDYNEAVSFAAGFENASVKRRGGSNWLWDNTPPFNVYLGEQDEAYESFMTFSEAALFAKNHTDAYIYYRRSNSFIRSSHDVPEPAVSMDVPVILQYPELFRGCEVTSLAMLLNYKGVEVDKMTLAEKIYKDLSPYEVKNGKIHYGNPNNGFVGDIYSSKTRGLGVYHGPVYDLALQYLPNEAIDLTGSSFEDLYYFLSRKTPVWIITNSSFQRLPQSAFETWHTPTGEVNITYKEHSVVITGYDDKYIYINDPLSPNKNIKKDKRTFIEAWEQMGRQAITYV